MISQNIPLKSNPLKTMYNNWNILFCSIILHITKASCFVKSIFFFEIIIHINMYYRIISYPMVCQSWHELAKIIGKIRSEIEVKLDRLYDSHVSWAISCLGTESRSLYYLSRWKKKTLHVPIPFGSKWLVPSTTHVTCLKKRRIHQNTQPSNPSWSQPTFDQLMVNWWFGAWWFGYVGSPYERDCYLGVPDSNPKPPGPKPSSSDQNKPGYIGDEQLPSQKKGW